MVEEERRTSYVLFFPLLFIAFMGEIVHLPTSIAQFRPDWTALVVLFFAIADPKRINVGLAWISGLLLDLLTGAPLGINALALATQVYIIVGHFKHIANYMRWQQSLIIAVINAIVHILIYWLEHLIAQTSNSDNFFYQACFTMLMWPIVYFCCGLLWSIFAVQSASKKEQNH